MQHKLTIKESFLRFMEQLLPFFKKSTHVRMSDRFRVIMSNAELSNKLADAIIEHKKELDEGKSIVIQDSDITITSVTSIPDTSTAHK